MYILQKSRIRVLCIVMQLPALTLLVGSYDILVQWWAG